MGILGIICLVLAVGSFCWSEIMMRHNRRELHSKEGEPRMAVLIPARDESKVVEGLLKDLARQTVKVPNRDVYVIAEEANDPTVQICHKHGCNVVFRKDLSKQRKGYALDDAVKEILAENKHYDLYFVFDADNLLAPDFVEQMLKSYKEGYEIVTSYRNLKNGNANVIAAVSGLTFAMINSMGNRRRMKHQGNMIFSGTGFFVDGKLVEEWRGWPFHSLTEDYELSLYATLHGISTYYNEAAVFYDEQPVKFSQTFVQRVRWIKGYFSARKHYVPLMRMKRKSGKNYGSLVKERLGVKGVIALIIGVVLLIADGVYRAARAGNSWLALGVIVGALVGIYIILAIITMILIRNEKLDLSRKMKIEAVLFNPIYLVTYVPCAVKALLAKDVTWQKIKHGEKD